MAKAQPPDTNSNSLKVAWRDLRAEAHGVGGMITVVIILVLVGIGVFLGS